MITMNRATYLLGRWKFSEDKANVKVIVRIWSLATSAAYHLIDQHASHCMGEMSESDFGFENSKFEPIERNCRFDYLSGKHFRFEDSAPEPIHRSVFATPFRPYKGKESDQ